MTSLQKSRAGHKPDLAKNDPKKVGAIFSLDIRGAVVGSSWAGLEMESRLGSLLIDRLQLPGFFSDAGMFYEYQSYFSPGSAYTARAAD